MIPDWLIYTGVATFVVGWAVWFQGFPRITLVLLAISVAAFLVRLLLHRRSRTEVTA